MSNLSKTIIKRIFILLWSFITIVAILIVIYMVHQIIGENSQLIKTVVNSSVSPSKEIESSSLYPAKDVKIYIISKNGDCLQAIETQIEWKNIYEENCKQILDKMKTLNSNDYFSPLSADINIRGVFLTSEGELIIDLPATITTIYKGKSTMLFENLLTYSIVNTLLQNDLVSNSPVKKIRFLIEGTIPSMDFPAHISWGEPFLPDYSFLCTN